MTALKKSLLVGVLLLGLAALAVANLGRLLDAWFADSVDPEDGTLILPGLHQPAQIRRDELGIPLVEADSMDDLAYAVGYVMASDRLEQMVNFSLVAQGRIAELAGPVALNMDIYMRTLGLKDHAQRQLAVMTPRMQQLLERFSQGVNAYLDTHRDRLPLGLALAGYQPEPWQPVDSLYLFSLLNLGLSLNLNEELAALQFAQRVGADKTPWLIPVYPDEPLPVAEAAKLVGLDLTANQDGLAALQDVRSQLAELFPQDSAASNNWVVAPQKTRGGASILANDTHLLLSQPPLWMLLQVRCPEYQAAGIALAGIPGIVAGYNGHVAWGMTMVMADSQDLFLEQMRVADGQRQYRVGDEFQPVEEHQEIFHIKGAPDQVRTLGRTRHGVLLNDALRQPPVNVLQPDPIDLPYGLALAQTAEVPDHTMEAVMRLGQAETFEQAKAAVAEVEFIHLNLVFADAQHIGWQVTGLYPKRRRGNGHFPSPGWSGQYDWDGFAFALERPEAVDPAQGFIATANHRTVKDWPFTLSSSWYYPERFERISQVLSEGTPQDAESTMALQFDRRDLLVDKVQKLWTTAPLEAQLLAALKELPGAQQAAAQEALEAILRFNGEMRPDSVEATYWGVFDHQLMRELFLDELGPEDSAAWHAMLHINGFSYSALQDHLLGRDDSPFWDDVNTPMVETKADILLRALAQTTHFLEQQIGADRAQWQWGRLHQYEWRSGATEMAPHLPWLQRKAVGLLSSYLDRGPYPAGGDRNTVNVAAHTSGKDFRVWDIPAMRLVVDFSRPEPVWLLNSGGQSGNPASSHYDDGIEPWLQPGNRPMAWSQAAVEAQYRHSLHLLPSTLAAESSP